MYDDFTDDHVRVERRQIAKDMDRSRSGTLDIDSSTAEGLIGDLRHRDIVSVVPDEQLFIHKPTGIALTEQGELVYFLRGWNAAQVEDP